MNMIHGMKFIDSSIGFINLDKIDIIYFDRISKTIRANIPSFESTIVLLEIESKELFILNKKEMNALTVFMIILSILKPSELITTPLLQHKFMNYVDQIRIHDS